MFKHNNDKVATGVIDLRSFWRNEEKNDQFRISVKSDSVAQVLFTKTKSRFNLPGGSDQLKDLVWTVSSYSNPLF